MSGEALADLVSPTGGDGLGHDTSVTAGGQTVLKLSYSLWDGGRENICVACCCQKQLESLLY